jgi:DNA-binding IclR family transcriptional regulator
MDKNIIDRQPSKTLARGLAVLEAFTLEKSEWGIRELSRELDSTPATVYRLVATLCNIGYLEQNPRTERYSLGPKVMRLAGLYSRHHPVSSIARRVFEQYAHEFRYNFYLGKLSGFEVVYLAAHDGHGPIKIVVEPGVSTAIHTTALGKVLLAFQDDDYVERFLRDKPLKRYTSRSITEPETLRARLATIRREKYAINRGEHYEDVGAIGVPLFGPDGSVELGVSLAYPQHFVQEDRIVVEDLIPLARRVTADIAARIGYSTSPPGR